MPAKKPFEPSEELKNKIVDFYKTYLSDHPGDRQALFSVLADFAAEVEMYCTVKVFEQMRQEWSETARIMLSMLPNDGKR